MRFIKVEKCDQKGFLLEVDNVASDKSISHRCAIFSLLSNKKSHIKNYLKAEDTLNTLNIVQSLGADVKELDKNSIEITPPKEIKEPQDILDCGNSGTAMRLFCGFLASKKGFYVLHGDKYLANRPMKRVVEPLKEIGAKIDGRCDGNFSPLSVRGEKSLKGFKYISKIASAQVKSAMILAGLNAKESSYYSEPYLSRDHSEKMLRGMGANIKNIEIDGKNFIQIDPLDTPLEPLDIEVPGDPSSAFFFAVAAVISENSTVILKNILLNPTRIEAFEVLRKMGADIKYIQKDKKYEEVGDIIVKSSKLKGVVVGENIAWLIDELPVLSIAMALADGKSIVKNAAELRVKESDRIKSVVSGLKSCGIKVKELEDGYEIEGGKIKKAVIDSFGDHRIAMSFAIAGLYNGMVVKDTECIDTSFPNFLEILNKITGVEIGN